MTDASTQPIRMWRSQGLHATVHLACTSCRAPGVYSDEERIRMDWPGCYVDSSDQRMHQPVGNRCPNCKASRGPTLMKRLGEIWRNNFT